MPWSWSEDSMAWNGLWWWRSILDTSSASFDGSKVGRLSEEKDRSLCWREGKK